MRELTSREILQELQNSLPRYRANFEKVILGFEEAKEEAIFSPTTEGELQKFIDHTKITYAGIEKSIILAKEATGESLDSIVKEILAFHEHVLHADFYLLVFIKKEYESAMIKG